MSIKIFKGLNGTQRAAGHIFSALEHLKEAKSHLLRVKNDQHIHLCINLGALEEIHGTLTDPVCTPEIMEAGDINGSEFDASCHKVVSVGD